MTIYQALPIDDLHARQESALRLGYWCEAIAYTHNDDVFWLGAYPAGTPRLALRWLRARARDIAEQLDPPARHPVRAWLTDTHEHENALTALAQGEMYTFAICDDTTRYALSARPTSDAPLLGPRRYTQEPKP